MLSSTAAAAAIAELCVAVSTVVGVYLLLKLRFGCWPPRYRRR